MYWCKMPDSGCKSVIYHRLQYNGQLPDQQTYGGDRITIDRIAGGKSVESWVGYDLMGMMQQLGVIPAPG